MDLKYEFITLQCLYLVLLIFRKVLIVPNLNRLLKDSAMEALIFSKECTRT